jgi:ABC-type Na+ transport system ATPase subunit NatA
MDRIVFESVHKIFRQSRFRFWRRPTETYALKEISLRVGRGEVVGLLGANGSGKSTTLKLISTMLLPDRGRVVVDGCDTRDRGQDVRRQVGFALAAERSFFPRLTVRENLEFFARSQNGCYRCCARSICSTPQTSRS